MYNSLGTFSAELVHSQFDGYCLDVIENSRLLEAAWLGTFSISNEIEVKVDQNFSLR